MAVTAFPWDSVGTFVAGIGVALTGGLAWYRKNRIENATTGSAVESIKMWRELAEQADIRANNAEGRAEKAESRAYERVNGYQAQIEKLSEQFHAINLQMIEVTAENQRLARQVDKLNGTVATMGQENADLRNEIKGYINAKYEERGASQAGRVDDTGQRSAA